MFKKLAVAAAILAILLSVLDNVQGADVSMCRLADGSVTFSDQGCAFGGDKEARFRLDGTVNADVQLIPEGQARQILGTSRARDRARAYRSTSRRAPSAYQKRLRQRELQMERENIRSDGTWAGDLTAAAERNQIRREEARLQDNRSAWQRRQNEREWRMEGGNKPRGGSWSQQIGDSWERQQIRDIRNSIQP